MDEMAKQAGLIVAISEELYMCELCSRSALFVEVEGGVCRCYKLRWFKRKKNEMQKIQSQKHYISGTASVVFKKAKNIIDWNRKVMQTKER